jgi:hypothetical protein
MASNSVGPTRRNNRSSENVNYTEGVELAKSLGAVKYVECTLETGAGVTEAFHEVIFLFIVHFLFPAIDPRLTIAKGVAALFAKNIRTPEPDNWKRKILRWAMGEQKGQPGQITISDIHKIGQCSQPVI